ncbi:uncharacterized protein LOC122015413 [Zingiber officinale]|uniref:uncharacterized protein LOC122015413 n=1 Tax=Zingiber officinale TaxID=94328 RepID=UPI001C4B75D9|nr:uncharacterized protein LOC122015413 [Zingiber officinale]
MVYLFDSFNHRNHYEDWKYVVDMSLKLFNLNKQRKGKKKPMWEVIKGPRQLDSKQCEFYVMKFMREIIEGNATDKKDSLSSMFMKIIYSNEEIDEVQSEWADCVLDYIHY